MYMEMERSNGSWFSGFLLGTLAGIAAAILMAPAAGTETRQRVKERYSAAKEKSRRFAEEKRQSMQQYRARTREVPPVAVQPVAEIEPPEQVEAKAPSEVVEAAAAPEPVEEVKSPEEEISGHKGGTAVAGKVSLNEASKEELMQVEGIGPIAADDIIAYRSMHGGFKDMNELKDLLGEDAFARFDFENKFQV